MRETAGSAFAFIAVGSNMDPWQNIPAALTLLRQSTTVISSSTLHEPTPLGPSGSTPFVNGVWQINTQTAVAAIKPQLLRPIETQLGRVRSQNKCAPRPIDLDLILYNEQIMDPHDLQRLCCSKS